MPSKMKLENGNKINNEEIWVQTRPCNEYVTLKPLHKNLDSGKAVGWGGWRGA